MPKRNKIKIGTRKSKLALWQANFLKDSLAEIGQDSELVLINSQGDLDQTSTLHNFGQTGVFTKALDIALLEKEIDLAIHSLKDYPTEPITGIQISTVGKRANPLDVLVKNEIEKNIIEDQFTIGTGSIRRRAQWKYKYPNTIFKALRGNVPTRLEKMWDSTWDGIIMAHAGLARLGKLSEDCVPLTWMIPAPAQGILGVSYRSMEQDIGHLLGNLRDSDTELCAQLERKFLNILEGGCSAPIGALASIQGNTVSFKGCIHDPDGLRAYYIEKFAPKQEALSQISAWVEEILASGGQKILDKIKLK